MDAGIVRGVSLIGAAVRRDKYLIQSLRENSNLSNDAHDMLFMAISFVHSDIAQLEFHAACVATEEAARFE